MYRNIETYFHRVDFTILEEWLQGTLYTISDLNINKLLAKAVFQSRWRLVLFCASSLFLSCHNTFLYGNPFILAVIKAFSFVWVHIRSLCSFCLRTRTACCYHSITFSHASSLCEVSLLCLSMVPNGNKGLKDQTSSFLCLRLCLRQFIRAWMDITRKGRWMDRRICARGIFIKKEVGVKAGQTNKSCWRNS